MSSSQVFVACVEALERKAGHTRISLADRQVQHRHPIGMRRTFFCATARPDVAFASCTGWLSKWLSAKCIGARQAAHSA
jgi:hypothetical protein